MTFEHFACVRELTSQLGDFFRETVGGCVQLTFDNLDLVAGLIRSLKNAVSAFGKDAFDAAGLVGFAYVLIQ